MLVGVLVGWTKQKDFACKCLVVYVNLYVYSVGYFFFNECCSSNAISFLSCTAMGIGC